MNNVFIILVKPQLGQNIGSVARVMKNLNFKNLRIVNPRDGWPNQDVISTAAGADDIITNTKVFDNVYEACNDLNYLFASSARKRDLNIKTLNLVNTVSFLNKTEFSRNDFKFGIFGKGGTSTSSSLGTDYGITFDSTSCVNVTKTIEVGPFWTASHNWRVNGNNTSALSSILTYTTA